MSESKRANGVRRYIFCCYLAQFLCVANKFSRYLTCAEFVMLFYDVLLNKITTPPPYNRPFSVFPSSMSTSNMYVFAIFF